jgi:hypothetical protein
VREDRRCLDLLAIQLYILFDSRGWSGEDTAAKILRMFVTFSLGARAVANRGEGSALGLEMNLAIL